MALIQVHPISNDELVRYLESYEIRTLHAAKSFGLEEKGYNFDARWPPRSQEAKQVFECQAGVYYVFDYQNVAPLDVRREVELYLDCARRARTLVAAEAHKVHRIAVSQFTAEVGQKEHRAF